MSKSRLIGELIAVLAIAVLANWMFFDRYGLFAFFAHSYGTIFQVVFMIFIIVAVYSITVRRIGHKSVMFVMLLGSIAGFFASVLSLVVAFAFGGNANGVGSSLRDFANSITDWSLSSWLCISFVALASFGWLYGTVLTTIARFRFLRDHRYED